MNYMRFKELMEKIGSNFSVAKLDGKIRVYFEVLSVRLSDNQFEKVTDFILKNNDRFPTIKTILDVARNFQEAPVAEEHPQCAACDSKGTVTAKSPDGYTTLFRCPHCQNCVVGYPLWSSEFKNAGYKLDLKDTGWNPNDAYQLKGLAMLGPQSIAWRKAPREMQEKAARLIEGKGPGDNGHISQVDIFSQPDKSKEQERKKNISFVEHSL